MFAIFIGACKKVSWVIVDCVHIIDLLAFITPNFFGATSENKMRITVPAEGFFLFLRLYVGANADCSIGSLDNDRIKELLFRKIVVKVLSLFATVLRV